MLPLPGVGVPTQVVRVLWVTASTSPKPADVLPVEHYVAGLARKRQVAGVLFRDEDGRVLLAEPTYKPNWEIPGGAVEADESPWSAAAREVAEELGLDRPLGRLLVVDYVRPQDNRPEGVVFLFDGGVLSGADLAGLTPAATEIRSVGFYSLDEIRARTKQLLADRIAVGLAAARDGVTALCEQGVRVA